jgi:hypothetical protein
MTDFRALCARMADELDHYRQLLMDDRRETHALAAEARAALAQPEPQGLTDEEPTDQEIEEWADAAAEVPLEEMDPEVHGWRRCFKSDEFSETIRAALRRWGRPAIEPQGPIPEVDDILRLAAIIRRVDGNHDKGAAALAEAILSHPDSRWQHAQPEPQGPTDEELLRIYRVATPCYHVEEYKRELDFARAVLARYGRPAIGPVPKREDVHYAWELHDAEGEWQAGGSADSLEDVQREGNRYLQTYLQDGPHKLIIERHCVTTIEPVPKREAEQ